MIFVPTQENTIYATTIKTGCLKKEFDSTYPASLNGIITQDEFKESMKNINKIISSRRFKVIARLILFGCIFGGIILAILSNIAFPKPNIYGFPIMVFVGVGMVIFGILSLFIGRYCIRLRLTIQLQEAVTKESMKYSMRSPTPCSWRLHGWKYVVRYGRSRITKIDYYLMIIIGNSITSENRRPIYRSNQIASQSTSVLPYENHDSSPPPTYNSLSMIRFCSQCGTSQQNQTAKFCSTCGLSFTKY